MAKLGVFERDAGAAQGDGHGLAVKSLAAFVNSDSVALILFATEAVDDGAALSF
jgi:uncharacterized protein (UPF0303 family)